jgi:hypothetical protein
MASPHRGISGILERVKQKTRFERVAPPVQKEKKPSSRVRKVPTDWEQQARFNAWFPFITEHTWEEEQKHTPREEILPDKDDLPPPPKKYRSKRIERYRVHETLKAVMQNALHQAYVSGYVEVVREVERFLPQLLLRHSRSTKLQKELREWIKTLKKDLATGQTGGP